MITIVNTGAGNLGSIPNMIHRLGVDTELTDDPERVRAAERLVIPGVGAFDAAVSGILASPGLMEALEAAVHAGKPVLGICLGMQLLGNGSDEGELSGLGCIPGRCVRLPEQVGGTRLRVPHMGWAQLRTRRRDPLLGALDDDSRFYFAHSYHLVPEDSDDVVATATYGIDFAAVVRRGNVWGVQFHPEKSHRHGLDVLAAFTTS